MAPQKYVFRFLFLMVSLVLCSTSWGQSVEDFGHHTCATAAMFCSETGLTIQSTAESFFEYHTKNSQGQWVPYSQSDYPKYGCLSSYLNNPTQYTSRAVVWLYFRIKTNGTLRLSISGENTSPDFCCWGPFSNKPTANQLTSNPIYCNDDIGSNKTLTIANAQTNKYYVIAITYFYQGTTLNVAKTGSGAKTYSLIDFDLSANTPCEGDFLMLEAENIPETTYQWIGPDSQTHSGRTWARQNASLAMSGHYTCIASNNNGGYGESGIDVVVDMRPVVSNITTNTGSTELCEGEEITLHTNELPPNVFYSPGDILCTDGSVVKPSDWPCGKTAKGVVFYVDATGRHGWAVDKNITTNSANQQLAGQTTIGWTSTTNNTYRTYDIPYLTNYQNWRDAIKDFDGYTNTQIIRNYSFRSSSPNTSYPAVWSVDFENGWYIPAAGQLNILFGELLIVNATLALLGNDGLPISTESDMWSSTEFKVEGNNIVRVVKLQLSGNDSTGRIYHEDKKTKKTVRAVIDF